MKSNLNLIEFFQLQIESRLNDYKILNGLTLLFIGFCIYFLQLDKFPLHLKFGVGFFLPLFIAILFDSKFILNIYHEIFKRVDEREFEKCTIRLKLTIKLFFAFAILALSLLTIILENIIANILTVTFISFQVSAFVIVSILLLSIKSAAYNERNKTNESFYNIISNEIQSEENIIESLPPQQVVIQRNSLAGVFRGRTTKYYLPFFCLLENTFFDYNKSNNEIGNWHKAIAELIDKKSGTVKITKNENDYSIDADILKRICVALQIPGTCDINDYEIYNGAINTIKNTFKNYGFILAESKIQELKLLVILYFYFENNKKGDPKIPDELNISSIKNNLLKKIKTLIPNA
ncbi:MAG: hypothetical protein IPN68_11685 [Bacteroidetes bacterium]|nr:hypothetical protein [Bacteroidota bacterium]